MRASREPRAATAAPILTTGTAFATPIGVNLLLCLTRGLPLPRRTRRIPEPFKEGVLAQFWR
ncbi:hypothetical protein [Streptomyces sp. NPDC055006]